MLLTAAGLEHLTIDRVAVVLAERAGPVVELGLAAGLGPGSAEFKGWAAAAGAGLDAQLEFAGSDPLPLHLIGFRAEAVDGPRAAPAILAVALALPAATRDWFDQRPPDADRFVWLVAQRGREVDPWAFLTGAVGDRLAEPPGTTDWNALFGAGACILRVGAWSNRCFFEHLVTLLTERTASVWGWAVVNDDREPLRLVTDRNPVALDDGWEPVDALPCKPTLLAGAEWARRPTEVRTSFPCDDGPALVRLLTTCGTQADVGQFTGAIADRVSQLVLLPGAVRYGDVLLYAASARYTWGVGGPGRAELTLSLRLPVKSVARPASGGLLLEADFVGWGVGDEPRAGEAVARLAPASRADPDASPTWAILTGESQVTADGAIAARVLTPFAGRDDDETAGLYITRRPADPFVIAVASGHAPAALGQSQRYDPDRESTGVTLNDLSLTLSASPATTDDDEADAIRLTAGVLRARAAEQVVLMDDLTLEPDMLTCGKDVTTRRRLAVEGAVTLSSTLRVNGNAAIDGKLDVGG